MFRLAPRSSWLSVSFAAAAALCAQAGNVLVVDATGAGGAFTQIEAAVQASVDGDVLLVKSGTYASFLIDGKSIDIVADSGASVLVQGGPRVINLAAGESVLLAGLKVDGIMGVPLFGGHGLSLANNAGAVRVEHCELSGASNTFNDPNCFGWGDTSGWEGAAVNNSANVAFSHCTLKGGRGMHTKDALGCPKITPGGDGGYAIGSTNSTVAVHESTLIGGDGGRGASGGDGGDGIRCPSGAVFVAGSTLQGGKGGYGLDWLTGFGGLGGNGIHMMNGTASATVLDSTLLGGALGQGFLGDGAPGSPVAAGVPTFYPGFARSFAVAGPARENTNLQIQLDGQPFDFALALVGQSDAFLLLPAFSGVLLASSPLFVTLGSLGATGSKSVAVPFGLLAPGESEALLPLQGVFVGTGLEVVLGSGAHQLLLDSSL